MPDSGSILRAILQRAQEHPDRVALRCGDQRLTFAELVGCGVGFAVRLSDAGAERGSVVLLSAERHVRTVAGMLGCWLAGMAFAPVDLEQPAERLRHIADATEAAYLAVPGEASARWTDLSPARLVVPGPRPDSAAAWADLPRAEARDLAYVMFTSGSTGIPKGVLVEHGSLGSLFSGLTTRIYDGLPGIRTVGANAPFTVDAVVKQVLMLAAGSTVDIIPAEFRLNPTRLADYLGAHEIEAVDCTPGQLGLWLDAGVLDDASSLRAVLVGGERISDALWDRLGALQDLSVFNLYGPTECTVDVAVGRVAPGTRPNVGQPLPGVDIDIVGADQRSVPPGAVGELRVGGVGVARGYLGATGADSSGFGVHLVDGQQRRYYATGDLARRLPDGVLEIIGRLDRQVKVRGFRVELGDIESAVGRCADVTAAAVVRVPDTDRIAAFAVGATTQDSVRRGLADLLPREIVPDSVTMLPALPLLGSGKVDHRVLERTAAEALDARRDGNDASGALDGTERETTIGWAVAAVTGERGLSRDESFYARGITSLDLMAILGVVQREHGRIASVAAIFDQPSIGAIADVLPDRGSATVASDADESGSRSVSPAQRGVLTLEAIRDTEGAYEFNGTIAFERVLDPDLLRIALSAIVAKHEIYRTLFTLGESDDFEQVVVDGVAPELVDYDVAVTDPASIEHDIDPLRLARCENPVARLAERWQLTDEIVDRAGRIVAALSCRRFEPDRLPLVRWSLLRFGPGRWLLLHSAHHVVHDGWSFHVFVSELLTAYGNAERGADELLEPLRRQFGEQVAQRNAEVGARRAAMLDYWGRQLAGVRDRAGAAAGKTSYRGSWLRSRLDPAVRRRVAELATRERLTDFTVLVAAFAALWSGYSGEPDSVLGTTFANRFDPDAQALIGMLVETAPVRVRRRTGLSFRDFARETRAALAGAHANCGVGYGAIVEHVNPRRAGLSNPLFQVSVNMHDAPLAAPDDVLVLAGASNGTAKFDLTLIVVDRPALHPGSLECIWEYSTDLFDAVGVQRIAEGFAAVLERVTANPEIRLADLDPVLATH